MTILNEAKFGTEGQVYCQLYEAPVHRSKSGQRMSWKYEGNPFFPLAIRSFWDFYSRPFSKVDRAELLLEEEINERTRFIKRPVVVMVDRGISEYAVIGGAWIDHVCQDLGCRADFHLKVRREARKYAYPLLDFFIRCFERDYDCLSVRWGPREEQDNPAKFFMNNGFQISGDAEGGSAILHLKDRDIINRIPIISTLDQ